MTPKIHPSLLPLAIGSDHGGIQLKTHLKTKLHEWGYLVENLGTDGPESVDYPDFATKMAQGILAGKYDQGILICGTGLGMSMMANRYKGIRAAVCTSSYMAKMARAHNDANILCLGERVVGQGLAEEICRAYLESLFEGDRHIRRIGKFDR
jgi:ribose 5-phosphate isomerase B